MSWVAAVALVGAGCVAAGGVLGAARACAFGLGAQAVGVLLLGVAGFVVLADGAPVGAGFRSGVDPAFGLDALSGFFLVVLCVIALPALAFARDALCESPGGGALTALTAGFLLAMAGLLAARDVTTFLACWELMTLLPAAAILVARRDAEVRGAVFVYLAVTHLGGVGVWVAMLVLAQRGRARRRAAGSGRAAGARRCGCAGRFLDEGGPGAAARVAAARAPGRAQPRLGADVGRDDQAGAVRPDARAVRVAGRRAAVGGPRPPGAWSARRRWRACCTR